MHSALFYITALLILVGPCGSMKLVGGADVLDHYSEFIIATKVPYASTKEIGSIDFDCQKKNASTLSDA